MSGGIIIQRAKVLLVAVTDRCMYDSLSATDKAIVDAIDAKDPASRTAHDVMELYAVIGKALSC